MKQLFKNYEIKHVSIQLIFSVTFALSLTLFELIIFEIAGVLESSSRFFHWRLVLVLILIMVVAVIPYMIAHSLISNMRFGKTSLGSLLQLFHQFTSSVKSLLNAFDNNFVAVLSLLVLANRGSLSTLDAEQGNIHHRAGSE